MYAIIPLDSQAARRFEPLAPFEVRDVIRGMAALPRVRAFGATLMGKPVGLIVATRDSDLAVSLGSASGEPTGRLLALTVAKSHRRMGVARALLDAACRAMAAEGVRSLTCAYSFETTEGTQTAEGFFAATGWEPPETTMVHCQADESFMNAPLLRELPPLPAEYQICDWVDLSADDRASIIQRQQDQPWYPPALDPFHFEPELEVINSLALRYHGEVVGWLLTHRTSERTMYYRCLFVRDDLARLGRGLSLLVEAIQRHWDEIGHQSGLGEWSTPSSLPRMIRFIRRHLETAGARIREQRRTRRRLAALPAPAGERTTALRAQPVVTSLPLLSRDEVAQARDAVLSARSHWRARREPLPFATLGASARLDALDSIEEYLQRAHADNAVLHARFAWLHERVVAALNACLGATVTLEPRAALPGFRITHGQRGAALPLAPIHCDMLHLQLAPEVQSERDPISFAIALTDPEDAGVTVWSLRHDDTIGFDSEETARALDASDRVAHRYATGDLVIRPGNAYHQRLPMRDTDPARIAITLEGHAFHGADGWRVYW